MRLAAFAALLTLCISDAVEAQQVWLSFGGGYASQREAIQDTVALSAYLEPEVVDARYPAGGGVLVDASGAVAVSPRLAFATGISVFRRTTDALLNARVPHPLHFAKPRAAEGVLADTARRDVAFRTELAWTRPVLRRLRLTVSGGPLAVHTSQSMARAIGIREQGYPFDVVELNPAVQTESAWGFGITGAINASWAATPRVAIGVTGRFSHATVSLRSHEVDAAGPSVIGAFQYRLR